MYKNFALVQIWESKVKGQGRQGQKNEKVRHFFRRELCRPPVLRRRENQRMLSSLVTFST